jgi:hypothetical protein
MSDFFLVVSFLLEVELLFYYINNGNIGEKGTVMLLVVV